MPQLLQIAHLSIRNFVMLIDTRVCLPPREGVDHTLVT
jgi:hypothetical protein